MKRRVDQPNQATSEPQSFWWYSNNGIFKKNFQIYTSKFCCILFLHYSYVIQTYTHTIEQTQNQRSHSFLCFFFFFLCSCCTGQKPKTNLSKLLRNAAPMIRFLGQTTEKLHWASGLRLHVICLIWPIGIFSFNYLFIILLIFQVRILDLMQTCQVINNFFSLIIFDLCLCLHGD